RTGRQLRAIPTFGSPDDGVQTHLGRLLRLVPRNGEAAFRSKAIKSFGGKGHCPDGRADEAAPSFYAVPYGRSVAPIGRKRREGFRLHCRMAKVGNCCR